MSYILTPSSDDAAAVQDALASRSVVELAAGETFTFNTDVTIPNDRKVVTDPRDPATIVRGSGASRLFTINGSDITVRHLKLDWNFAGSWVSFTPLISFELPNGSSRTPVEKSRVNFFGLEMFDSGGVGVHNGDDCWGIVLTNDSPVICEDIAVVGCRMLTPGRQLTAGGNGLGYDGLRIAGNYIVGGRSNSISVSSRGGSGVASLSNVTIERNVTKNAYDIGIFVGQDGSADDYVVNLDGIVIQNNYVSIGSANSGFPHGMYVRVGTDTDSFGTGIEIKNNTIDLRNARGAARIMSLIGYSETDVLISGNKIIGNGESAGDSLDVTQSNNVFADGRNWSLGDG
jgi:hypothetical protein